MLSTVPRRSKAGHVFVREAEHSLRVFQGARLAARRAVRGEVGKIVIGFKSMAGLVAAGFGISVLPASVQSLTRKGGVLRPIRNSRLQVQLALLWRLIRIHPRLCRSYSNASCRDSAASPGCFVACRSNVSNLLPFPKRRNRCGRVGIALDDAGSGRSSEHGTVCLGSMMAHSQGHIQKSSFKRKIGAQFR